MSVRIGTTPISRIGIATFVPLLAMVAFSSPKAGTLPLFAALVLAGPVALGIWTSITWPVATLIGAYSFLAPADDLLAFGGGATITRFVAMLAVSGLLIALLRDRSSTTIPRFVMVWFAVLAWMIASVFWATDQSMAVQKVEQIGLAVLVFMFAALVQATRAELRVIVAAIVGSSAAIAAYAITVHPVEAHLGKDRVVLQTTMGGRVDPNDLAAGMILAFALCIAAATTSERVAWRITGGLLSLLLFAAILATDSRGGLLATLLVVVWTAVRARNRFVAGGLLAAVVSLSVSTSNIWQRFIGDETGAGRSDIWKVGVAAFREHWLIGSGIGTFPDAYNSVYLAVPHHFYIKWSRPAHDLLVQSFTELGIVGGILVLTAFWFQFRALISIHKADPDRWLRVALEATTLGYFVAALFIDTLDMKQTWVIPIVIAVLINVRAHEAAQSAAIAPAEPGVTGAGGLAWPAVSGRYTG
jgi:O-antigen ligase